MLYIPLVEQTVSAEGSSAHYKRLQKIHDTASVKRKYTLSLPGSEAYGMYGGFVSPYQCQCPACILN